MKNIKLASILDVLGLKVGKKYVIMGEVYTLNIRGKFVDKSSIPHMYLEEIITNNVDCIPFKWRPSEGEKFYTVQPSGSVYYGRYRGTTRDIYLVAIDNCFETFEEAEEKANEMKVIFERMQNGATLVVKENDNI